MIRSIQSRQKLPLLKPFLRHTAPHLRNEISPLKTEISHLHRKFCLLKPLQEKVYNSRAPIFQVRGERSVFTDGGRVSADIGLVSLEEETNGLVSALEWKQRFQVIYGIDYGSIAPRIDTQTSQRHLELQSRFAAISPV
jgi:hypothetical protein